MSCVFEKVIVAFDCDGVLADFDGLASEKLGIDLHTNRTAFNTSVDYGPEVHKAVGQLLRVPSFWVDLRPLPGARDAVRQLLEAGHQVHFYSSLPSHFAHLRSWWLWWHLKAAGQPQYVHLWTPAHRDKPGVILDPAQGGVPDYYIDDRADTVQSTAIGGVSSYLHWAPWNQEPPAGVRLVHNVTEYVDAILQEISNE